MFRDKIMEQYNSNENQGTQTLSKLFTKQNETLHSQKTIDGPCYQFINTVQGQVKSEKISRMTSKAASAKVQTPAEKSDKVPIPLNLIEKLRQKRGQSKSRVTMTAFSE